MGEIIMLALATAILAAGASSVLEKAKGSALRQSRAEMRALLSTISFLSSTVVVQLVRARSLPATPTHGPFESHPMRRAGGRARARLDPGAVCARADGREHTPCPPYGPVVSAPAKKDHCL